MFFKEIFNMNFVYFCPLVFFPCGWNPCIHTVTWGLFWKQFENMFLIVNLWPRFIKTAKQFAQIYGILMSPHFWPVITIFMFVLGSIFQPRSLSETVKPQSFCRDCLTRPLLRSSYSQRNFICATVSLRQQELRGPKQRAEFTSAAQLV